MGTNQMGEGNNSQEKRGLLFLTRIGSVRSPLDYIGWGFSVQGVHKRFFKFFRQFFCPCHITLKEGFCHG